jgi:hypothetical protein
MGFLLIGGRLIWRSIQAEPPTAQVGDPADP